MGDEGKTGRTEVAAPAKVNLSLLVGPPRGDGYHPLCTLYVPIDVFDTLVFSLSAVLRGETAGRLSVRCAGIRPEENLVVRAIRAVEEETGWNLAGEVEIQKGIPIAAGLGGGSSDAAAALRAAAALVAEAGGPAVSGERLLRLAVTLGADVPFFLRSRPALASGIGEVLEPVPLPSLSLVLILPEEELHTGAVYRSLDAIRPEETREDFAARCGAKRMGWKELCGKASAEDKVSFSRLYRLLSNDLQEAALRLAPHLQERLRMVRTRSQGPVLVSGSGPSLFTVCASREEAGRLAEDLKDMGLAAVATTTSPLC